ncbi:hypothetical protein CPB85DRAFT_1328366 [Mucidula mucida]|nr:hypothetical protein CPB85DRAFT_1328366 [Mucidula mucida]
MCRLWLVLHTAIDWHAACDNRRAPSKGLSQQLGVILNLLKAPCKSEVYLLRSARAERVVNPIIFSLVFDSHFC